MIDAFVLACLLVQLKMIKKMRMRMRSNNLPAPTRTDKTLLVAPQLQTTFCCYKTGGVFRCERRNCTLFAEYYYEPFLSARARC